MKFIRHAEKDVKAQDKEYERTWNDNFVERTGGYKPNRADLSQLFDMLGLLAITDKSVALDAGCGIGKCSFPLAELGYKVIGIDISGKAIEVARQIDRGKGLDIKFIVGDLENLPFEDDTFDIVFCGGVLHHFPDLQQIEHELYRVLKEGGRLYAYEANRANPVTFTFFTIAKLCRFLNFVKRKFSENERALSPKELVQTLKSEGFSDFFVTSLSIKNQGGNEKVSAYMKIRELVYFLCARLLSPMRGGSHLVLSCTKKPYMN